MVTCNCAETPLVVDFSAGMVKEAEKKGLKGMHLDAESYSQLEDQRYTKVSAAARCDAQHTAP